MIQVDHVSASRADASIAAFVGAHPAATAYAMPGWLALIEQHEGAEAGYLVATKGAAIAGVLPIARRPIHALAARALRAWAPIRSESLGRDSFAGPLLDPALDRARADDVLDALIDAAGTPRAIVHTMFLPAWAGLDPVRDRLVARHGYHARHAFPIAVKDLRGLTPATLAASYHQSHKRAVAAADKRGVEVFEASTIEDFLTFYDLYTETMEHADHGAGFTKDHVVEGGRSLVRDKLGKLFMAKSDGVAVAGVFALSAGTTDCYWLGATAKDEHAQQRRPMNAVFHRVFLDAIARGASFFELGGLVTEGLRTFKMRWGAREYEQTTLERSPGDALEELRRARAWLRRSRG